MIIESLRSAKIADLVPLSNDARAFEINLLFSKSYLLKFDLRFFFKNILRRRDRVVKGKTITVLLNDLRSKNINLATD